MSCDPLLVEDGSNIYCYVRCNPILFIDKVGEKSKKTNNTSNDLIVSYWENNPYLSWNKEIGKYLYTDPETSKTWIFDKGTLQRYLPPIKEIDFTGAKYRKSIIPLTIEFPGQMKTLAEVRNELSIAITETEANLKWAKNRYNKLKSEIDKYYRGEIQKPREKPIDLPPPPKNSIAVAKYGSPSKEPAEFRGMRIIQQIPSTPGTFKSIPDLLHYYLWEKMDIKGIGIDPNRIKTKSKFYIYGLYIHEYGHYENDPTLFMSNEEQEKIQKLNSNLSSQIMEQFREDYNQMTEFRAEIYCYTKQLNFYKDVVKMIDIMK